MTIKIFFLSIASLCFSILSAQNPNAAQLRQQMAKIRQSTDWSNPEAARKANEQIRELSKQIMIVNVPTGQNATQPEAVQSKEAAEAGAEYRMKLWEQMWATAKAGENADIDLARPLREEIKKAYEEDESRQVTNPLFFEEMTYLCIDMSSPYVSEVIAQMEKYKAIRTLVITGGKNGAPVDLSQLITKAGNYPLESLYIINFGNYVSKIPESVSKFHSLKLLGLYNNSITGLPAQTGQLVNLEKLYVDMNPLSVLIPSISNLSGLDTLGIAKTQITEDELNRIAQQLPTCKILTQ